MLHAIALILGSELGFLPIPSKPALVKLAKTDKRKVLTVKGVLCRVRVLDVVHILYCTEWFDSV